MQIYTVETAIEFVHNKFHEFTAILDVELTDKIDIICKDLATNRYYEVYSNEDFTKLRMIKLNLK